ncbi:hypothetical protein [Tropicibacter oceani]|uniref:Uncharacterized protein n=1 Tax=Tropicibacter oceani TaxID=3058420 RepID=A0ABY8QF29_9RHOB|nr:hypothetical protein [Tropicibacter oceani]WGW03130.1 hypothetical protein QF118_14515 [Tropicibacter oceani]
MDMNTSPFAKRVYSYKAGTFQPIFMSGLLIFAGLIVFVVITSLHTHRTYEFNGTTGQHSDAFVMGASITVFVIYLGCCLMTLRWLQRNRHSSRTVVLDEEKVQRPMSKGDRREDYLSYDDVLSVKVKHYPEGGPELVVSTRSGRVAYKSVYFESAAEFTDFCHRMEQVLNRNGTAVTGSAAKAGA